MLIFFSPIVFVCILSLWTIQPLGSDTLDSVSDEVTLMACVPGWIHHWLDAPTISTPPLPQHIP